MTAAAQLARPDEFSRDELVAELWRAGKLSWKLHSAQKAIYDKYRAWELTRQNDEAAPKPDAYPRIFCIAKSGRFGGSTLSLLIKTEDCIRNPGRSYRISSAFQKNISEIVNDVSHVVFDDAPEDQKPVYKGSQGAQGPGFYFPLQPGFTRQSVLRLIGLDLHPDGSRGQASDGDVITEAGYVVKLKYVVKNVVYRQYQGRPWASMILETSAPNVIDTDWETVFLPDAVMRGAASFATIEDNPLLSRHEKDEFIAAMGGRGHPDCEREYFNVIAVDPASRVVPEWDETRHVQDWPVPAYAHGYVTADPGTRDLFGLLWGYWDFGRAALYFQRDWAEPNALNNDVAEAVRAGEQELWGTPGIAGELVDKTAFRAARKPGVGPDVEVIDRWLPSVGAPPGVLCWYDGKWLRANPHHRISDIDLPLCAQLSAEHRLEFNSIVKSSKEAMANSFRDAVSNGKVIAHPRCTKLNAHLKAARWNKGRTDWERATAHGHFDLLACAIYMWWWVKDYCHLNPNAPYRPMAQGAQVMDRLPWQKKPEQHQLEAIRAVLGRTDNKQPGRLRVTRR
jgi:hypothetical protein